MNYKVKKTFLEVELIELEYQETLELWEEYNKNFNEDFRSELQSMNNVEKKQINTIKEKKKVKPSKSHLVKRIYRNLAKIMHPDVCKDEDAEEQYKKLTKMYDDNDLVGIICYANSKSLKLSFIEAADCEFISKKIEEKRKFIFEKKQTVSWFWATSEKEEEEKKKIIYDSLGLNNQ